MAFLLTGIWTLAGVASDRTPVTKRDFSNTISTVQSEIGSLAVQIDQLSKALHAAQPNTESAKKFQDLVDLRVETLQQNGKLPPANFDYVDKPTFDLAISYLNSTNRYLAQRIAENGTTAKEEKALVDKLQTEVTDKLAAQDQVLGSVDNDLKSLEANVGELVRTVQQNANAPPPRGGLPLESYAALALLALSLAASLGMLLSFRAQVTGARQETGELKGALGRLGTQMQERIKAIDASSQEVKSAAASISDCLANATATLQEHVEGFSKRVNSALIGELAAASRQAFEQMARLWSETKQLREEMAGVQNFMAGIQKDTGRWIQEFEKQTKVSLTRIETQMQALDQALWPEPFLGDGRLGTARERIREQSSAGDKTALALLLALGEFQVALAERGGPQVIETLDRLGIAAYRFWRREPGASVETIFESAQAWGTELNKLLMAANLPLCVRIIMPRASFDMDTMVSEHSLTGTTFRVKEPLSWTIISKNEEKPKVLVTGKVITE